MSATFEQERLYSFTHNRLYWETHWTLCVDWPGSALRIGAGSIITATGDVGNVDNVDHKLEPKETVQCSAVQCSAVQCSAVQCSAVQCRAG
jgi:hypothetical protein